MDVCSWDQGFHFIKTRGITESGSPCFRDFDAKPPMDLAGSGDGGNIMQTPGCLLGDQYSAGALLLRNIISPSCDIILTRNKKSPNIRRSGVQLKLKSAARSTD